MLDAALATTETDDGVALSLRIENGGSDPVTLDFRTGQRAEFTAYPAGESGDGTGDAPTDGDSPGRDSVDSVWRYGAGRMFTQALASETLAPGESVEYEGTWRDPPAGTYRTVGEATVTDRDVRAETTVVVEP
ncbi:hypothetical protein EKH57_04735 [Halorubrum sp. BOL3-1]|uniref:BsuPI-related putative proteinase inhibitor n=1 Tax=Halorubrum sp. BOL3-1 TaxID=2497325 RepID=UPI00100502EE|nr:BsuPI-related putative proteinase inhibitor [Halorubrum sp. BOL3-1]QAU12103.1 hypothetical protein EKH57_04735 [Halorubrum sp. BOL3-1]